MVISFIDCPIFPNWVCNPTAESSLLVARSEDKMPVYSSPSGYQYYHVFRRIIDRFYGLSDLCVHAHAYIWSLIHVHWCWP